MDEQPATCFFCNPDESRIVARTQHFFLLCGMGPITEGYVILASKRHSPSMLDLDDDAFQDFQNVLPQVESFVTRAYERPIMLEHGRIAACTHYDRKERDHHCYHSHLLIFPTSVDILPSMEVLG